MFKWLNGKLTDDTFQDILLEELNQHEFNCLINIVKRLIQTGHSNLYASIEIAPDYKYVYMKDCDLPDGECYSLSDSQLGGYWLSRRSLQV